jgi:hypothetical protein
MRIDRDYLNVTAELHAGHDSHQIRKISPVPRWGKGLPPLAPHPHPRVQPPTSASLRTLRTKILLTKLNTLPNNRNASVASLRRCSPSDRNGVRLPSGMLFSFAGIPTG